MTNKEAIRVLKSTSINLGRRSGKIAYVEALEMAIKALENNSNEQLNNSTNNSNNSIKNCVKGMTACRVPEDDCISRTDAVEMIESTTWYDPRDIDVAHDVIGILPFVQPEYEPVTAEDFAKTMSKNTLYSFMAWHGEALALMKEQGFVICKKTM